MGGKQTLRVQIELMGKQTPGLRSAELGLL